MMEDTLYNIVGFAGAALVLFGFYRISSGKWTGRSFWYELDNVIGASCLIIYQVHLEAYISAVLNVIWAIVAIRGVASFAQRYRAQKNGRVKKRA